VRIISKRKLIECWEKHPECKRPLTNWYNVSKKVSWENINQVKDTFPYVSILSNSRIVFNIKGNDFRLIIEARFKMELLYICWVGTHAEYNKIDANTIWDD